MAGTPNTPLAEALAAASARTGPEGAGEQSPAQKALQELISALRESADRTKFLGRQLERPTLIPPEIRERPRGPVDEIRQRVQPPPSALPRPERREVDTDTIKRQAKAEVAEPARLISREVVEKIKVERVEQPRIERPAPAGEYRPPVPPNPPRLVEPPLFRSQPSPEPRREFLERPASPPAPIATREQERPLPGQVQPPDIARPTPPSIPPQAPPRPWTMPMVPERPVLIRREDRPVAPAPIYQREREPASSPWLNQVQRASPATGPLLAPQRALPTLQAPPVLTATAGAVRPPAATPGVVRPGLPVPAGLQQPAGTTDRFNAGLNAATQSLGALKMAATGAGVSMSLIGAARLASPTHVATMQASGELLVQQFGKLLLPAVENISYKLQGAANIMRDIPNPVKRSIGEVLSLGPTDFGKATGAVTNFGRRVGRGIAGLFYSEEEMNARAEKERQRYAGGRETWLGKSWLGSAYYALGDRMLPESLTGKKPEALDMSFAGLPPSKSLSAEAFAQSAQSAAMNFDPAEARKLEEQLAELYEINKNLRELIDKSIGTPDTPGRSHGGW